MKQIIKLVSTALVLSLVIYSCDNDLNLPKDVPNCIEKIIKNIKNEEIRNPPAQVWEWEVDGSTYFYITSDCCDQFNYLYDRNCEAVCAPDGGFAGTGDGNCPTFNGEIVKTLIWEDSRQ